MKNFLTSARKRGSYLPQKARHVVAQEEICPFLADMIESLPRHSRKADCTRVVREKKGGCWKLKEKGALCNLHLEVPK